MAQSAWIFGDDELIEVDTDAGEEPSKPAVKVSAKKGATEIVAPEVESAKAEEVAETESTAAETADSGEETSAEPAAESAEAAAKSSEAEASPKKAVAKKAATSQFGWPSNMPWEKFLDTVVYTVFKDRGIVIKDYFVEGQQKIED